MRAVDGVHNDAARLGDLEEFVEGIVTFSGAR